MRAAMLFPLSFGLLVTLAACDDKGGEDEQDTAPSGFDTHAPPGDDDGDGVTADDGDCDDNNPDVYPGRAEDCNGVDDNCNGLADEGFPDTDEDGIADCVDEEECDNLDNDGDGQIDEDFPDTDGDGVKDCLEGDEECDGVDNNGDGQVDEGFDADGDGHTECGPAGDGTDADCDDTDASINPDAAEVSGNLIDDNCNGLVDEGDWAEGDLVINEIMNNPAAVNDPSGEWFEVTNTTDRSLILNGLVISSSVDGDWHQVTADDLIVVEAGGYAVLAIEGNPAFNGGVDADYQYSDITLTNESDEISIEAEGLVIDSVTWDDGATFPDLSGKSMTLDPNFLDIAENDNGANWCAGTRTWDAGSDAGTPGEENQACWPVAVAAYTADSSLYTCDTLYLDGTASTDPEGLTLSYSWELVSAPAASTLTTADLSNPSSPTPNLVPDESGSYVFSLTVYNGTTYSPPDYLTVSITVRPSNTAPTADAGDDQTYSESASCTPISYGAGGYSCDDCADYDFDLDGSDSWDVDGDEVHSPSWSITSGSASITDDDTWSPTVTVTGPTATYGSTSTTTIEATLTVEDCMGATNSDTVNLNYECTGT